jgi:APA family basic amino acid/polyamine antiporter
MSEEAKNSKVIPKAIILSLIISTILYILVSISVVSIIDWKELSLSQAPLASVASKAVPESLFVISIIALFSTSNTVLITLLVASRLIYGLAENRSLPRFFARIGKRNTPYVAIASVALLALVAVFVAGVTEIALLTTLGLFLVYIFVNLSVIILRYREPKVKRSFRIPLNIGKFPVTALIGLVTSVFMIINFSYTLILFEVVLIFLGFIFYKIFNR